ncbi:MAG: hypothetical protein ACYC61_20010 [Isosphaeraceae bacterium]
MDQNKLLSSAVETGLDLLDQHGSFLPFCTAVDAAGQTFIYVAGSEEAEGFISEWQASESVRCNVRRDLRPRGLVGAAFGHHVRIRFAESPEMVPAVKVELHDRGRRAVVWHFLYKLEGGSATVLESFNQPAEARLFADLEPGAAPEASEMV